MILVNCGFAQGSADISFCRNDPQLMRDWLHIEQCVEYQAFILQDALRVALKLVWGKGCKTEVYNGCPFH